MGLAALMFAAMLAGCGSDNKSRRDSRGDDAGSDGTDADAGSEDSGTGDGPSELDASSEDSDASSGEQDASSGEQDASSGEQDAGSDETDAGSDETDAGSETTPPGACAAHSVCEQGAALPASCNECTQRICASDPVCCDEEWDHICVANAELEPSCGCEPTGPTEPSYEIACGADVPTMDNVPSGGTCGEKQTFKCNPVTNGGCKAHEACDVDGANNFRCWPESNDKALCEACSEDIGYCQAGYTCRGVCARFCCNDADCGPGNKCLGYSLDQTHDVGICVAAPE